MRPVFTWTSMQTWQLNMRCSGVITTIQHITAEGWRSDWSSEKKPCKWVSAIFKLLHTDNNIKTVGSTSKTNCLTSFIHSNILIYLLSNIWEFCRNVAKLVKKKTQWMNSRKMINERDFILERVADLLLLVWVFNKYFQVFRLFVSQTPPSPTPKKVSFVSSEGLDFIIMWSFNQNCSLTPEICRNDRTHFC